MRIRMRSWFLFLLVLGLVSTGFAQKREMLRTVRGTVIGPDGKPLPEAVVHLKNRRTGSVLTVLTDAAGAYDFSGIPMKIDYELYVEYKDLKSVVKKFSGLDRRSRITLDFDLRPQEKETEKPAEKPAPPSAQVSL